MIGRKGLRIVLATMLGISIAMVSVLPVAAQGGPQAGDGGQQPKITSLSELERLYPMSPEAEAAIVHEIPPVPVIIDGITYEPKEVALFNGQRLRFTPGKDGQMYAFTTIEGLEKFLHEQSAVNPVGMMAGYAPEFVLYGAALYQHIQFLGTSISLQVNYGNPDLGDMNNQVSSLYNLYGYETVLFDYVNYGGDYCYFSQSGYGPYWALWGYGWNDRANSAICFPI